MRMPVKPDAKSQQGMTLLEVIIALAIFATAALALLNSMSSQMNAVEHFRTTLFASWVAENALVETQIQSGKKERETVTLAGQQWFVEQQHAVDAGNKILLNRALVLEAEGAHTPILSVSSWTHIATEKP
ncbi:type II secretion system minor pseudopilin GspI [Rahnella variigena]|jgi:general secretion pathway protein I|uniref:Type II secretion system protein I n=2 Tax=Rahnella variigena TaxID=574964 RepID=A0ABX9PUC8_9GAMM|nr:type II secretion system minor pseudopilin GspI [Rahnella variigena]RBQ33024.1 type II secretion system protein GspI [Rahnella aquatilis]RJT49053.1 type II secretion system protein GspI [Rahnella variigena]RKF67170.1 type II secretion system protein GspI [Rahnella variigena]